MRKLTLLLFFFTITLTFSQEKNNFIIKDKKATITLELENKATEIELHKEKTTI